ncbi:MAG: response regulator [Armatimonadetes bacterium]|nr:response regulator [Armatimonadota bacterium]MBX3108741.1 response regulator [Fimbriimonadaceae bacterium]
MSEPICVVVIEDELAIRRFLKASFGDGEAELHEASTGAEGLTLIARKNPQVVLLDLGLPDQDGLDALRELRTWSNVPVIVLTARGKDSDKVTALDSGADDYLTKPFSVAELMARIRVAMRRAQIQDQSIPSTIEVGLLSLDLAGHIASIGGAVLPLTQIEFKLLAILAQNVDRVVTQRHLLREVWGPAYEDSTHTLRVHMANLRQKVKPTVLIKTDIGVGYRLIRG